MRELQKYAIKLRELLINVAKEIEVYAVLLSGGLDSSITTYLVRHRKPLCITIVLEQEGRDVEYARKLTKFLRLHHVVLSVNIEYAIDKIPEVIKILRTFSPMEIPNDVPILIAFEYLRSLGYRNAVTGDGGDELFCGYSYMFRMNLQELEQYLHKLPSFWYFPSLVIGSHLGLEVKSVFLNEEVIDYALRIPVQYKILHSSDGLVIGKYVLRLAFSSLLPDEIVWRRKEPIELGSGFTLLRKYVTESISDEEFEELRREIEEKDKVTVLCKEQLYYYTIYRRYFEPPYRYAKTDLRCPYCGADLNPNNPRYCYVCGASISSGIVG